MKQIILLAAAASSRFFAAPTLPVCIIGAGPAGLTIANRLEAKGQNTVIFEKQAEVGGKCQAFYENGLFHPLGALLFSNQTYKDTLPIIDASGVSSVPFAYTSRVWLFNWRTGYVYQSPASPAELWPFFKAEVERYINFWKTSFNPNMTAIPYKIDIPQEYTVTTFQWLAENNYMVLGQLFVTGMVSYGYGDITQVPIIYMLRYFTPDITMFFAGKQVGYITDFHKVFVRYAQSSVHGPIHTSTFVTKIDRSGDYPAVTYRSPTGTETRTQSCSKLILAFPPILDALNAANLDISEEERNVFSPLGITNYWSSAVRVVTPDGFIFSGFPSEADGQPVSFMRLFNESDIATMWSWGKYRSNQSTADARNLLIETISRINKDPRNATEVPKKITNADIKEFRKWDYFAHYDPPQLEEGYTSKFFDLQGKKNTYYVSGLNGFETVEYAIRAGKDIVDTYFN